MRPIRAIATTIRRSSRRVRAPSPRLRRDCTSHPSCLASLSAAGVRLHVRHVARRRRHLPDREGGAHRGSCHARRTRRDRRAARRQAIGACQAAGGRIVAVGTTTLRLIETAADESGRCARLVGGDRAVHHARLSLQGSRSAADQLPPSALDVVHAGLRVRRDGSHEDGLRACAGKRATASTPTATPAC